MQDAEPAVGLVIRFAAVVEEGDRSEVEFSKYGREDPELTAEEPADGSIEGDIQ